MILETSEIQCGNRDCRVAETGKCVEGLALDTCPHIARSAAETLPPEAATDDEDHSDLPLAKSERMTVDGASAVMRAAPTKVATIIGPSAAGKTSLVASVCELFQKGPVSDLQFATSGTLFAFEQACHHSRAVSRRTSPQTEHTSLASGVGFYHLGLCLRNTTKIFQLLFADRSGEDYRSAADDPSVAEEFVELRRADVVTALVNGELLLDLTARHNVQSEMLMILQGLLNGDVFSSHQRLALVLTKLDVIRGAKPEDQDRTERDFHRFVDRVNTIFGEVFSEIRAFKIAASPASTVLAHGFGVPELLQYWAEPGMSPAKIEVPLPKPARALGRFGCSNPGGSHN